MSPSPARAALPRRVARSARLYVRPAGLCRGEGARTLVDRGAALPLAGGPLAFTAAEVYLREDEDGGTRRAVVPLGELRTWGETLEAEAKARVEGWLERLSAPRRSPLDLSADRPLVMGILNVTPDSFSDGGDYDAPAAAIARGRALVAAGADIVDVGGESTRPGADPVAEDEELARVIPVLEGLRGCGVPLSVDTRRAGVMAAAAVAGAAMINDVSALTFDPESLAVAAATGLPVVLMHSRGEPRTMNRSPAYGSVLLDVYDELERRIDACARAGISGERLILDPGIGFAKTPAHNTAVLDGLALYHGLGHPLMLGVSRKLGRGPAPKDRLPASLAGALWGVSQGVRILRVHDVAETREALAVWRAPGHGPEPAERRS